MRIFCEHFTKFYSYFCRISVLCQTFKIMQCFLIFLQFFQCFFDVFFLETDTKKCNFWGGGVGRWSEVAFPKIHISHRALMTRLFLGGGEGVCGVVAFGGATNHVF